MGRRRLRGGGSFHQALWVILAVSAPSAGLAQALPRAACAGWHRAAALTLEGTVQAGGLDGRFTLALDPRDGRNTSSRDFGVFSQSSGFDGKVGWARDRSGGAHDLNAAAGRAISITESWILRHGWCELRNVAVEPMPDELDGDVEERVWRATPRGGVPVVLRFARRSGLLHRAEYRLWGNRLIRHYDDWRDAGRGLLIAFSERDEDPEDEDTQTITLSSVKPGSTPFPPSAFTRPPRPNDYAIVTGADSTTVPYEDDGGARIYVSVFVDGKGPYAFEIDTGGHLIIGAELATALALKPAGRFSNTGAGTAITQTGLVADQEIRIGGARINRQVASVRPFANDRVSGKPPRAGLLGLELFERFAVEVDRANKTVTLTPLEEFKGGRGTALPIRFIEDAPLTTGAFNGHAGDFEIDSGNAGPTIIEGYWAHELGLDGALSEGVPWSAGTGSGAYQEWLSRGDLSLGPIRLAHQLVSYVGHPERGSESTRLQAGVAGEWALRCFDTTYDYRHGTLWIGSRQACGDPLFNRAGVRVTKSGDALVATVVVPGTPAAAAGIKVGDRIVALAGQAAATLSARDAALLLAGPIGSGLDLAVAAQGEGAVRNIRLKLVELVP
jgi:PDZ domain